MGELLSLGVMGIRGSFSEEAALEYARDNNLGEVEIVELLTPRSAASWERAFKSAIRPRELQRRVV